MIHVTLSDLPGEDFQSCVLTSRDSNYLINPNYLIT